MENLWLRNGPEELRLTRARELQHAPRSNGLKLGGEVRSPGGVTGQGLMTAMRGLVRSVGRPSLAFFSGASGGLRHTPTKPELRAGGNVGKKTALLEALQTSVPDRINRGSYAPC